MTSRAPHVQPFSVVAAGVGSWLARALAGRFEQEPFAVAEQLQDRLTLHLNHGRLHELELVNRLLDAKHDQQSRAAQNGTPANSFSSSAALPL